ncbi:hypothetical protein BD410DRAFT_447186 [Rickenella mellea]|uniref:Uncharacterized protein n=1 Tax=Rickenella mellea TaxID=50990 RepID=A0A4Y7PW77_9AGAM|nr:hypothetical protein BD410DRAFT_447186 [Rickenella mellea]
MRISLFVSPGVRVASGILVLRSGMPFDTCGKGRGATASFEVDAGVLIDVYVFTCSVQSDVTRLEGSDTGSAGGAAAPLAVAFDAVFLLLSCPVGVDAVVSLRISVAPWPELFQVVFLPP